MINKLHKLSKKLFSFDESDLAAPESFKTPLSKEIKQPPVIPKKRSRIVHKLTSLFSLEVV